MLTFLDLLGHLVDVRVDSPEIRNGCDDEDDVAVSDEIDIRGGAHSTVDVAPSVNSHRRPDPRHRAARRHRIDELGTVRRREHAFITCHGIDRDDPDVAIRPVVTWQPCRDDLAAGAFGHGRGGERITADRGSQLPAGPDRAQDAGPLLDHLGDVELRGQLRGLAPREHQPVVQLTQ